MVLRLERQNELLQKERGQKEENAKEKKKSLNALKIGR